MKTKIFTIFAITLVLSLFSCSKENQIAKDLEGVWNVDKIEFTSASDTELSFTAENVGTIEFKDDNTGKNDYTYTVNGEDYNDNESFKWENTEEEIVISGNANDGSKETVFVIDDGDKDTQEWTSTEADGDVLKYTLTKQD